MADLEIGIHDKALRNLVIILMIPIVSVVWVGVFEFLIWYQANIWPLYGAQQGLSIWLVFTSLFVVVSMLEFVAIIRIKFNPK